MLCWWIDLAPPDSLTPRNARGRHENCVQQVKEKDKALMETDTVRPGRRSMGKTRYEYDLSTLLTCVKFLNNRK